MTPQEVWELARNYTQYWITHIEYEDCTIDDPVYFMQTHSPEEVKEMMKQWESFKS